MNEVRLRRRRRWSPDRLDEEINAFNAAATGY
jgi:hypothetical protein